MKEASWEDCIEKNSSIKVTPDKQKSISLLKTAKERIKFLESLKLDKNNAKFIFENYYTSLIEIIHSSAILKGFKIINHLCVGYYLKEVLKKESLFRDFDKCRYNRNSIVYYGKDLDFGVSKEGIKRIKDIIRNI